MHQKFDFSLYLGDCLLHLVRDESRYGGLKVVYNALKTVTLQYFPLMTAQQAQGHLEYHLCALDKQQVYQIQYTCIHLKCTKRNK